MGVPGGRGGGVRCGVAGAGLCGGVEFESFFFWAHFFAFFLFFLFLVLFSFLPFWSSFVLSLFVFFVAFCRCRFLYSLSFISFLPSLFVFFYVRFHPMRSCASFLGIASSFLRVCVGLFFFVVLFFLWGLFFISLSFFYGVPPVSWASFGYRRLI